MTIEQKILAAADAIKRGQTVYYRQYHRGGGNGWCDLKFLVIDFLIENPKTSFSSEAELLTKKIRH